jgi:hypothetical protein
MNELEFDLYVPVISQAGAYDKRPIMNGLGEVVTYISFGLAEKAGHAYISEADNGFDMALHICRVQPGDMDESINH